MTLRIGQSLRQNRYLIQRRLGEGGMGTVYLAIDRNLNGQKVAIKENTETSVATQQQFRREAETLTRLNHQNLPRVTNFFIEVSGRQYLVMDFIEGDDLQKVLLKRREPLLESDVLQWTQQIMDALHYLHTWREPDTQQLMSVIHRDIKPSNIKLTRDGRIYLVDFGIAKFSRGTSATFTGARAFSAGFSPIEQYSGGTDIRSDIYSLGATLYALLTYKIPPEAPDIAAGATLRSPRAFNPRISRRTERVILRAMRTTPSERYQSIMGMRSALFPKWPNHRFAVPWRPNQKAQKPESGKDERSRRVGDQQGRENQRARQIGGLFVLTVSVITIALLAIMLMRQQSSQPTAPREAQSLASTNETLADTEPTLTHSSPMTSATTSVTSATRRVRGQTTEQENRLPTALTALTESSIAPTTSVTKKATIAPFTDTHPLTKTPQAQTVPSSETPTITPGAIAVAATPTRRPRPTPTNEPTPTMTPTMRTIPTAMRHMTPSPVVGSSSSATLLEPLGDTLSRKQLFRWQTDLVLDRNQAFEVVFWQDGGTAMRDGLGPVGNDPSTAVEINVDTAFRVIDGLHQTGTYRWGVLLVQREPYVRLAHIGGNHRFRLGESGGGSGRGSSGGSSNGEDNGSGNSGGNGGGGSSGGSAPGDDSGAPPATSTPSY